MSDYMFMLENHLTASQTWVVRQVQDAAAEANLSLFLTGGAVRDMIGGFVIRDLDFTVEGNPSKLAKQVIARTGATLVHADESRKAYDLAFPGGVRGQIAMARLTKYGKPGSKPHISTATIYDDLRGRDFTVNALALSLNRASRGLLLDPANGLADLEKRELRTITNYAFYDSPVRLLRLHRLKIRLGFGIADRTQAQYDNAREAGIQKYVTSHEALEELKSAASDPNPFEVLRAWETEKLLELISPILQGPKLNAAGFGKLHKARQLVPFGSGIEVDDVAVFFNLLNEKLTPKERSTVVSSLQIDKETASSWQKLEARAKKAEKEVAAPSLQRPSKIYKALSAMPGEVLLYLLVRSTHRLVQDRIKNYLQKYVSIAQEINDRQVVEAGGVVGTPKFEKLKWEMIAKRLDARPKKVQPEPVPEAPPPPAQPAGRPRSSASIL